MEVSVKRSDELIADFVNGKAVGWFMRVPECFKRELDIQLTPRVNPEMVGVYLVPAKVALSGLSSQAVDSALSLINQIECHTDRVVAWANRNSNDSFEQMVMKVVDTIKRTKDKRAIASIVKKKHQVWTQGRRYCFAKDQILHSSDDSFFIQIESAIPAETPSPSAPDVFDGHVKFLVYRLVDGKTEKVSEHSLTQHEFVRFLKFGENLMINITKPASLLASQQPAFQW